MWWSVWKGVFMLCNGVGRRLMRYAAVWNAKDQKEWGKFAWCSSALPASTICLCLRSAGALCSGVCGRVVKCEIPWVWRKFLSFKNSPPLSEYKDTIGKLKYFSTTDLNTGKNRRNV